MGKNKPHFHVFLYASCVIYGNNLNKSLGEKTTPAQYPMKSIRNNVSRSMGRPTGWGRRPHLIQYLL